MLCCCVRFPWCAATGQDESWSFNSWLCLSGESCTTGKLFWRLPCQHSKNGRKCIISSVIQVPAPRDTGTDFQAAFIISWQRRELSAQHWAFQQAEVPTWELAKLPGQPTEGMCSAWCAGDGANLEMLKSSALSACMECLCPCTMKTTAMSLQGQWEQWAWEAVWRWNIWQWDLAVFVAVAVSPSIVPRVPGNLDNAFLSRARAPSSVPQQFKQPFFLGDLPGSRNSQGNSYIKLVWGWLKPTWTGLKWNNNLILSPVSPGTTRQQPSCSASGSVARYGLITALK